MSEKCAECERVENLQKERDGTDEGERDGVPKNEPADGRPQFRAVEGMDPETGNFIRIHKQQDEEHRNDEQRRDQYSANIVLDPTKLSIGLKTEEKGTWTGPNAQWQWSRRFASTLTNRSRSEIVDEDEQSEGGGGCLLGGQIRFTIMVICTLCLSAILSNILAFNFTYICMAGERPENFTELAQKNASLAHWEENEWKELGYHPNLDYSNRQRSMLFMAVAVGSLITVFPLTVLLSRFGSRLVFGSLGYVSAIATLLLPLSANLGFPFILGIRIIQGAAFSACLPVMGSITSNWSSLKQNGIFIAILSSFLQIAPIFTMPVSGALCTSSLGWPSVYYLHGIVSLLLFTFFMLYHRNSPTKHPMMVRAELVKVLFGKGSIYSGPGKEKRRGRSVPLRAFYSDKAIWAILVASFGNFMGTQLSLQFMPTYINKAWDWPKKADRDCPEGIAHAYRKYGRRLSHLARDNVLHQTVGRPKFGSDKIHRRSVEVAHLQHSVHGTDGRPFYCARLPRPQQSADPLFGRFNRLHVHFGLQLGRLLQILSDGLTPALPLHFSQYFLPQLRLYASHSVAQRNDCSGQRAKRLGHRFADPWGNPLLHKCFLLRVRLCKRRLVGFGCISNDEDDAEEGNSGTNRTKGQKRGKGGMTKRQTNEAENGAAITPGESSKHSAKKQNILTNVGSTTRGFP